MSYLLSYTLPVRCFVNNTIYWLFREPAHPPCWVNLTSPHEPSMSIKIYLTSWTTIMAAYILENDVLPIFDVTRAIIKINATGWPVHHSINVVTITTDYGFTNDRASPSRKIYQPDTPTRLFSPHWLCNGVVGKGSSLYHDSKVCLHPWSRKSKNHQLKNQVRRGALQASNHVTLFRKWGQVCTHQWGSYSVCWTPYWSWKVM